MEVTIWPVAKIIPYARNARKLSDKSVDKVAASIKEFGWRQPIVVDKDGVIIAGHTRLLVAHKLCMEQVPVHVAQNLTPAQVKAYRLMDNRSNDEAEWDMELLGPELMDLQELDLDLSLTGFDDSEIDAFLAKADASAGLTDEDAVPEAPEHPVTELGDLWILGRHRLLCGDSTSIDAVDRLLAGGLARMVVTSPPYNQNIETFTPHGMHKESHWFEKVERLAYADSLPEREYQEKQKDILSVLFAVITDGSSVFYNHKNRYRDKRVISPLAWLPGPFSFRQEIIWSRPGSVTQNARMFLPSDERIYWMYKGDDFTFDDSTEIKTWSTVWDINLETNKAHPVAFPVELPTRCLRACSMPDDVVLDPYGGSGTTLIACEKTGRNARLMEIDPKYCDVIIKRWQDFTGKIAKLDSDGRTFSEHSEQRAHAAA